MSSTSIFSKQYWTEALATACYTQNRSTIVKRHLKTPYEIFRKRIPNIDFLHVFPVYIHNHKDHLGKLDEKADDGYFLGYSLVSKAFRVFNTRRQQTKETYHIIFNESPDVIKFTKPLVDNINIAKSERYPSDEYLHPYKPSQRYQTNSNDMSFIEPYESLEPIVLKTKVSSDQNGDPRARMLTRSMAKELSAASAHECLFVDFLSEEEPKKVSEALKHPEWDLSCLCHLHELYSLSNGCHGKLKEEVYVKQPPSFESSEFPNHVFKLDKVLYGLRQAPKAWYLKGKALQVPIFCDNTSAIAISNNPVMHSRTKHVDIRYHFIRDHILKGDIELHFIPTQYQLTDIFTKPLDEPTFKRLIVELAMLNIDSKPEPSVLTEEN
ncbi:retrovirus-related pol polyprotein from transposon TNT 1-94 [Tanacetum coccineum]